MKKRMLKSSVSFLSALFVASFSYSQEYQIDVTITELDEPDLYLGYYLDGKTYVADTAEYLGTGKYSFRGDEPLDQGMYFLAKSTTLLFDLVVGEDQRFELSTAFNELVPAMQVVGDQDNQLFFENMNFNLERKKEGGPFIETLQDSTAMESEKSEARKEIDAINVKVSAYQDEIIANYPESILTLLLKSGKQVEIPEAIAAVKNENDKLKRFKYYKDHYWDLFDLGNPILLRLPNTIYKRKVDEYLDNLTHQNPDSIKTSVDRLAGFAKSDETTYQYLVWYLTIKYQTSKIMGLDEVYVHIVDNYFLTGEMDFWANDQLKKNLNEKADQYRNSLLGMVAPNLVLQDLNKQPKALHDMSNDFTVIYFYDPDCGHCKKETPVLKAFIETTKFDVGVYSVSADTSMTKMNDYINEVGLQNWTNTNGTKSYGLNYQEVYDAFTTPTIYLLNGRKEIIAKKIAASQLNEAITNYESMELQKAKSD